VTTDGNPYLHVADRPDLLSVPEVENFVAWLIAASPNLRMAAVHLIREQVCIWCGNLFIGEDARCTECPRGRQEAERLA
jgi:hypothetical protein